MFENLKAVCEYKTPCKVVNGLPTYQCTCGDNIATHRCSEEKCPFMTVINAPVLSKECRAIKESLERSDEPKTEFKKVTLDRADVIDSVEYDVFDSPEAKYTSRLVHTVNVKFNAHTDDQIMKAIHTIVGEHFTCDISIDKEKVIEAFDRYQKKKVKKIHYKTANGPMASYCCPVCDKTLLGAVEEKYCLRCGQHLDWEVE